MKLMFRALAFHQSEFSPLSQVTTSVAEEGASPVFPYFATAGLVLNS